MSTTTFTSPNFDFNFENSLTPHYGFSLTEIILSDSDIDLTDFQYHIFNNNSIKLSHPNPTTLSQIVDILTDYYSTPYSDPEM